jgi:hypothetical protein
MGRLGPAVALTAWEVVMKHSTLLAVALVGLVVTGAGCREPRTAGPPPLSPEKVDATNRIAEAQGERSQVCRSSGLPAPPDRPPERLASELGLEDCAGRIEPRELDDCIDEIGHLPCADADAARVPTCRIGAICRALEEGTL